MTQMHFSQVIVPSVRFRATKSCITHMHTYTGAMYTQLSCYHLRLAEGLQLYM